jgi:hypothetical protein
MLRRGDLVKTTRLKIPEDGILHSHRRENLKSYRPRFDYSPHTHTRTRTQHQRTNTTQQCADPPPESLYPGSRTFHTHKYYSANLDRSFRLYD